MRRACVYNAALAATTAKVIGQRKAGRRERGRPVGFHCSESGLGGGKGGDSSFRRIVVIVTVVKMTEGKERTQTYIYNH